MNGGTLALPDLNQILDDVLSSFVGSIETGPGFVSLDFADTWLETWVDITGSWHGEVVLAVLGVSAPKFAAAMLGTPGADVSMEDTADALCELINMVGGQVKSTLPAGARLSLPRLRMCKRAHGSVPAVPSPAGLVCTIDWVGHPLRVTVRSAP